MNCLSISYKNTDEKIRGSFAFTVDVQKIISEKFNDCVILCTCNRTEIYSDDKIENAIEIFAEYSRTSVNLVKRYAMIFYGRNAISHLFRVACGIESMVVGEDEILGQVKNAYKNALEWKKTHYELNMIFQSAIACAKKIKTETSLSNVSVSTATLTANEVVKFCKEPKVLVIGATGKIGQTIIKNLISHKNISLTITLRNHSSGIFINIPDIEMVDYKQRYNIIDKFDCVISATSGPHYTITFSELMENLHTPKKRLFIDLAVPNDIDRKIIDDENINLIGIDYFQNLASENNIRRTDSVELAKKYIEKEIDAVEKSILLHYFIEEKDINESEKKLIYKLRSELDANQFSAVLDAMKKE